MRIPIHGSPGRTAFVAAVLSSLLSLGGARAVAEPGDVAPPPPLTAAQLDELVAPIALYPDVVLDALLPATAAPGDVAAAAQYVTAQGGSVQGAPQGATWDPSLVALLQFPDVVKWMGENPAWVEQLGFAVSTQQPDVLAAIQRYRAKAQTAGALVSNEYQAVTVQPGPTIVIETISPQIVYVPVYDPWLLDTWQPGYPFFNSWFSFSFGASGYWGRHRIFWGSGIYDYGDPWWGGRWRPYSSDWGTSRASRWYPQSRNDQPWRRGDWNTTDRRSVRPTAPRTTTTSGTTTTRSVQVIPPAPGGAVGTRSRTDDAETRRSRWQPTSPAAPVTRWPRTPSTTAPTTSPTPTPGTTVQPTSPTLPRTVTPTPTPMPRTVDRPTVNEWRRRGNGSLEGRQRSVVNPPTPRVVPTPRAEPRVVPTPRASPRVVPAPQAVPRIVPAPQAEPRVVPKARTIPPPRPDPRDLDRKRIRDSDERGRKSLSGS